MLTFQELVDYNKDRWLNQVSIIVPDIQKAVEAWVKYMKVGPFIIIHSDDKVCQRFVYDGKVVEPPYELYVAIAKVGGFEVELIQPVVGPNSYNEFLERTGGGIHHIKFTFHTDEALADCVKEFSDMGLKLIQEGDLGSNKHAYFDTTKELLCMIEMGNNKSSINDPGSKVEYRWYPPKED